MTTTSSVLEYLAALNDGIRITKVTLAEIRDGTTPKDYAQVVFERAGSVTWQLREFMALPDLDPIWLGSCEQVAREMDNLREQARALMPTTPKNES